MKYHVFYIAHSIGAIEIETFSEKEKMEQWISDYLENKKGSIVDIIYGRRISVKPTQVKTKYIVDNDNNEDGHCVGE